MAEVVRLSIVYETSQAAAALRALDSEVSKFNRSQAVISTAAPRTARAVNTLKQGISSLAFQAAGLPGPLGKMSTTLLAFAGGSALTLSVVAGLGLMSAAFNKVGEAAESAEKLAREAADRITAHLGIIRGLGDADLAGINDRIDKLRLTLGKLRADRVAQGFTILDKTRDMVEVETQLGELEARRTQILIERQAIIDDEAAERHLRTIVEENERLIPLLEAERDLTIAIDQARRRMADLAVPGMPSAIVPDFDPADTDFFDRMAREAELATKRALGDPQSLDGIKHIGELIGRTLVNGIVYGFRDGADIFRALISMLLEAALSDFTTDILRGISIFGGPSTGGILPAPAVPGISLGDVPTGMSSVQSNVTFNVQAMDAQSVAVFFEREGGRIAATVAKQAARSKSLRTQFAR